MLAIRAGVQGHKLTCVPISPVFLTIQVKRSIVIYNPSLVELPRLSLEGCFIFSLEFSMPCFPLHIKGWKSRWWTRSHSTGVSCQVSLADFISSYSTPLPVWPSQGEHMRAHIFLSFSCLLVNYLGCYQEKRKWKSHTVGPKYCWF